MKNKYSVLPRRIQKYYRQERPKRIISEFMRERFYLPASFVKQLSYADEPFYFEYTAKTWNDIEYNLYAKKGIKNRTSIVLQAKWRGYTFSEELKNNADFFFLLFFIMIRIPKSGIVGSMRIGRDTLCEMCRFDMDLVSIIKKRTMVAPTRPLPFDIEKGLSPNRILEFLSAKSRTRYLMNTEVI